MRRYCYEEECPENRTGVVWIKHTKAEKFLKTLFWKVRVEDIFFKMKKNLENKRGDYEIWKNFCLSIQNNRNRRNRDKIR